MTAKHMSHFKKWLAYLHRFFHSILNVLSTLCIHLDWSLINSYKKFSSQKLAVILVFIQNRFPASCHCFIIRANIRSHVMLIDNERSSSNMTFVNFEPFHFKHMIIHFNIHQPLHLFQTMSSSFTKYLMFLMHMSIKWA